MPLYLLAIFGKNEKTNISAQEKKLLAKLVKELLTHWRQEMSNAFTEISAGLNDAISHAKGDKKKVVEHNPDAIIESIAH